jgi:hypothetical protein
VAKGVQWLAIPPLLAVPRRCFQDGQIIKQQGNEIDMKLSPNNA